MLVRLATSMMRSMFAGIEALDEESAVSNPSAPVAMGSAQCVRVLRRMSKTVSLSATVAQERMTFSASCLRDCIKGQNGRGDDDE
jgi:hypothetical protein